MVIVTSRISTCGIGINIGGHERDTDMKKNLKKPKDIFRCFSLL
jgi:hypothetical protein